MQEVKIKIYGRVQGVFFRAEASDKAQELGIKGYVRNEPDGTVAVVAQGDEANVQDFINWCRKGPELASVDNVEVETSKNPETSFDDFVITY